jgi:hypothetical protein
MKVLRRSQVTQVHIERVVSHDLEVDGKTYTRYETVVVGVPYMDMDILVQKPQIKWDEQVGERTVKYLKRAEVKALNLEGKFGALDINDRNGNGN